METEKKRYTFRHQDAEFCYDAENLRLMKGTTRIEMEHKPREVLAHLLKNPQRLIRHRELKAAVWGDTHVEDASVHNAVSKINVALKSAQPGADFIKTTKGVGVEFLVAVDPVEELPRTPRRTESKIGGSAEAVGQGSTVVAEPSSLTIVGSKLLFRVRWTEPPYTTLTLHVDQPLFEKFPGDWFYRGEVKGRCPQLYVLLLSGPGIRSVMRESPYELLMGKAELAQYDMVAAHIHDALRTATGIQDISCADRLAPAAEFANTGHPASGSGVNSLAAGEAPSGPRRSIEAELSAFKTKFAAACLSDYFDMLLGGEDIICKVSGEERYKSLHIAVMSIQLAQAQAAVAEDAGDPAAAQRNRQIAETQLASLKRRIAGITDLS
jgi:DNA-binding winged helix-turn-helix (wHTH) protein